MPVEPGARYGARPSREEYERQLTDLYGHAKATDSSRRVGLRERAELDLVVDYKLGVDFPPERREALWRVQKRVGRRRYVWLLWRVASPFLRGALSTRADPRQLLEREYGAVLDADDLKAFLADDRPTERDSTSATARR